MTDILWQNVTKMFHGDQLHFLKSWKGTILLRDGIGWTGQLSDILWLPKEPVFAQCGKRLFGRCNSWSWVVWRTACWWVYSVNFPHGANQGGLSWCWFFPCHVTTHCPKDWLWTWLHNSRFVSSSLPEVKSEYSEGQRNAMYSLFTPVPALSTRLSVSVVSGWCLLRELMILAVERVGPWQRFQNWLQSQSQLWLHLQCLPPSLFSSLCLSFSQSSLGIWELMSCSSNNHYQDVSPV